MPANNCPAGAVQFDDTMLRVAPIFMMILSALSLLACLAVGGLWIRSAVVRDFVELSPAADGSRRALVSQAGRIWIGPMHQDGDRGKRFVRKRESRQIYYLELLGLAATPMVVHLLAIVIRKEARRRAALCKVCQRDLRDEDGRCPWCTPELAKAREGVSVGGGSTAAEAAEAAGPGVMGNTHANG